ncbi:uncharacterized protein LOC110291813 [Mus caroli]|uniref:Uncharacterized protein LOC110291813 n=1 Tax=Mus caroli TaxID=10089 RepID=A0A6P5PJE4_MUSCR|nr:uncharacterized protein LOC110291813 [Mus caroli]
MRVHCDCTRGVKEGVWSQETPRQEGPGRPARGPGALYLPGRAAAAVPRGSRAQHNLLSFPGGDSAAPKKTVFLAFATIRTEIEASLESWGGRTRPESPPAAAVRPGNTVDAGSSFGRRGTRRLFPALPLPLSPPLGPAAQSWTRESGGGRQTENPGRKLLAFPAAPRGAPRPHPTPVCFSGSIPGVWGCSVMRTRMGSSLRDGESDVYEL